MLQDVLAERQTEVDFMNGAIVKWGEKLGVPTPLNRAVWALVKGLEHSWTDPASERLATQRSGFKGTAEQRKIGR